MSLELQKYTRSFCTIMHQIDPQKFTQIINEADIILKTPNRWRCRTQNIQKKSVPKVTKTYEKNGCMVTDDFLIFDMHYKLEKVSLAHKILLRRKIDFTTSDEGCPRRACH